MRSVTLGHYLPGNSLLHRLDPRIKLLSLLILIIALFLVKTFTGFILFAVFILI
ncbi:MAG TPA: transporter, partial [Firmicutes bacterium]|nr:transporter [Bacillota bacterium]